MSTLKQALRTAVFNLFFFQFIYDLESNSYGLFKHVVCTDCHNVFALMCRSNQELKEKLYSFMITDEAVDKPHFLRQLCRQMANTVCKPDAVS